MGDCTAVFFCLRIVHFLPGRIGGIYWNEEVMWRCFPRRRLVAFSVTQPVKLSVETAGVFSRVESVMISADTAGDVS